MTTRQIAQRRHIRRRDQVQLVAAIDRGQAEVVYAVRTVDDHELVVLSQKADSALNVVERNIGRIVKAVRRGQDVQAAGMMNDEALQQALVQPSDVAHQLVEVIVGLVLAQIERDVTQAAMLVEQQSLLAVLPTRKHPR